MSPILETAGCAVIASAALAVGIKSAKIHLPRWLAVYIPPLTVIILIRLGRHFSGLSSYWPFTFILSGRTEFALLAAAVPMMFGAIIPKVSARRLRGLLYLLMGIGVLNFTILPFLLPVFTGKDMANTQTYVSDNICLQTTNYTCGPASAVTALRLLGVDASEADIALEARTTRIYGTAEDLLADAIEKEHRTENISCSVSSFKSVEQLKNICPVIATIKHSFLIDHYITILEVTDCRVITGDPLVGKKVYSLSEFEKIWRFSGIVVRKTASVDH